MSYTFHTTVSETDFAKAVESVTTALKTEGFGVLTEIDIKATLKKKLDVDHTDYMILGACNPPAAFNALQAEERIGVFLPCNVIVHRLSDGNIEVAAVDPVASMMSVKNERLGAVAADIRERLQRVINTLN